MLDARACFGRRQLAAVVAAVQIAVVVVGPIILGGCTRPAPQSQGQRGEVMAAYSAAGLEAKLPAEVSVLAVRAAAEAELRARGYIVTSSTGTKDRARVVACGAGESRSDALTITARVAPRSTFVNLDPGWLGDESAARAVLDGLLARLGR